MNLTSSKIIRIIATFLLVIIVCLSFTACKADEQKSAEKVDDGKIKAADQVSVTEAVFSSTVHILSDKDFISEIVELFNSLEYKKSDKDIIYAKKDVDMYIIRYSDKGKLIKTLVITRDGLCAFEVGTQVYEITSEFDFDALDKLIKGNIPTEPTVDPETIIEVK